MTAPASAPRILAGRHKGRPLATPRGRATRPLAVRVRKSLFDALGDLLEEARLLDLYAGCGTVTFEALSRGAAHATAVECAPAAVACLRRNARLLGETERTRIVAERAERFVEHAAADPVQEGGPFDILFVGAPYPLWERPERARLDRVLSRLGELAAPGGLVVVEHRGATFADPPGLVRRDERRFGDTRLRFLEKPAGP